MNKGQRIDNSIRSRFLPVQRPPIWEDVTEERWGNWIWQQQNRIRTLPQLEEVVHLSMEEREAFERCDQAFHVGITPYYAALMDRDDRRCPVRLQAVPTAGELTVLASDRRDPLGEERDMVAPGVTHRYPDRVLWYVSHHCPVYCRHCTRKRKVSDPTSAAAARHIDQGLAYIAAHREVRDVVISGGDPLTHSDYHLESIISRLRSIPHVEIIRLGTRNPVTLPQRVTPEFAAMLSRYHPIFVHTHFNHPKECTQEAFDACERLVNSGCVVQNQMVLLAGVNDSVHVVKDLNQKLLLMRVRPYYIYQCDLAEGISHFRTPVEKGIEIIEGLRGWTSGMAVPHFVIDAPGGGGKIPLIPNYVVTREENTWVLRNFKGDRYEYKES